MSQELTVVDGLGPNWKGRAGEEAANAAYRGAQAALPIVAAVSQHAKVHYAEFVVSLSRQSAGPWMRANVDAFVEALGDDIERMGGATKGRAILVLSPAAPPPWLRTTVFMLCESADAESIQTSIESAVLSVQASVPGYRLKQAVQLDTVPASAPLRIPQFGASAGLKISVYLEVVS